MAKDGNCKCYVTIICSGRALPAAPQPSTSGVRHVAKLRSTVIPAGVQNQHQATYANAMPEQGRDASRSGGIKMHLSKQSRLLPSSSNVSLEDSKQQFHRPQRDDMVLVVVQLNPAI